MVTATLEVCPPPGRPVRRDAAQRRGTGGPSALRWSWPGLAAAAAALLLAGPPAARAQDQPAPPAAQPTPQPATPPTPPAAQAAPPAASETIPAGTVLRLLGRDVTSPDGQVVAQIVNLLVDAAGQPQAAILDYGGFLGVGKRRIAVVWRALRFAPDRQAGAITLALGPDQLKNFPEFKADGPLVAAAPPEPPPGPPVAEPPDATRD